VKNGNGTRVIMAALTAIGIVVGLVIGSMGTWIRAGERFVDRAQYERESQRIERKLDQLLKFHMDERRQP